MHIPTLSLSGAFLGGFLNGLHLSITTLLVLLTVVLIVGAIAAFARSLSKEKGNEDFRTEIDSDVGFGPPCPNCHSHASSQRDFSFEKRRCESCGQKFEVHG